MQIIKFLRNLVFAFSIAALSSFSFAQDLREYQHGIDFVPLVDGTYWLIWSSSGHPPTGADRNGSWTHDVYTSHIDPADPKIGPKIIIAKPEAQEPASSAINDDGHIMITMEDGWNTDRTVAQRYGVYDSALSPVKAYPNDVFDGGHSGHVAAVGKHFVVFYSDEWVDGGGVDDLGSGDDVLLKVYDSQGILEKQRGIVVGSRTRDWWPLVAGGTSRALLLWQRFVDNQEFVDLMIAVYDPATGRIEAGPKRIEQQVKYYTYDVQYLSGPSRFLVQGAFKAGGGFAHLIDESGDVIASDTTLPALVREAQPAIRMINSATVVLYPSYPTGLMALTVTDSSIALHSKISGAYAWQYMGTDGIFLDDETAWFVSFSRRGLVEQRFDNMKLATAINEENSDEKKSFEFKLGQNYPNPFHERTCIPYSLSKAAYVSLSVFNVRGQVEDLLAFGRQQAGSHAVIWEATNRADGVYFYRLQTAEGWTDTGRLLLLK